jgi:hypothetical protein
VLGIREEKQNEKPTQSVLVELPETSSSEIQGSVGTSTGGVLLYTSLAILET